MRTVFCSCILSCVFLVLLGGCRDRDTDSGDVLTLAVNEKSDDGAIDLAQIVDSVTYVPLETKPESLVGTRIIRVLFADDLVFVVSVFFTGSKILIFDTNGKHLRTISRRGRGPGEYLNIDKAMLDEMNRRVIIYDQRSFRMLFYDYDGNFTGEISKFAENYYPDDIIILPNGNYLCYKSSHVDNGKYLGDVWEVDSNGVFLRWVVPTEFINPSIGGDFHFYPLKNDQVGFTDLETLNCHYYDGKDFISYCRFSFAGRTAIDFEGMYNRQFTDYALRDEQFVNLDYLLNNGNYIFSDWYDDTGKEFYVLYDRSTGALKTSRTIADSESPKFVFDNDYAWGGFEFVWSNNPNVIVSPVSHDRFYDSGNEYENPVLQLLHVKTTGHE